MQQKMSKQEQIGFHKGAVDTLLKERQELLKMVSVVSKLLEMHVEALKKLGVDLTKQVEESKPTAQKNPKPKPKKEDEFGNLF